MGCDGDRLYFDGSALISLNGHLLAQSPQFTPKHVQVVTATVDLDMIQILRGNRPSFTNTSAQIQDVFPFRFARIRLEGVRLSCNQCAALISPRIAPFYHPHQEEVALGPALWMWDYLRKSGCSGFCVPLSGGLDSSSCVLIVYSMAKCLSQYHRELDVRKDLMRVLGLNGMIDGEIDDFLSDPRNICQRILHTAYLGTKYSSKESRKRADNLAKAVNSHHQTFFVDSVVDAAVSLFSAVPIFKQNFTPKYQSEGGSRGEDLALQNLQVFKCKCLCNLIYVCF